MAEIQAQVIEFEGMPSRNGCMGFFRKDVGNPGSYELWYKDSRGYPYLIAGSDFTKRFTDVEEMVEEIYELISNGKLKAYADQITIVGEGTESDPFRVASGNLSTEKLLMSANGTHPSGLSGGIINSFAEGLTLGLWNEYDTGDNQAANRAFKYTGENKTPNSRIKVCAQCYSMFGPLAADQSSSFVAIVRIFRNGSQITKSNIIIGNGPQEQMGIGEVIIKHSLQKGDGFMLELPIQTFNEQWLKGTQEMGWKLEVWETPQKHEHQFILGRTLGQIQNFNKGTGLPTDEQLAVSNNIINLRYPGPRINDYTTPMPSGYDSFNPGDPTKDPCLVNKPSGVNWWSRTSVGVYNWATVIAVFQAEPNWDDQPVTEYSQTGYGPDFPIRLMDEGLSYNNVNLSNISIKVTNASMGLKDFKLPVYDPDNWTVVPNLCYFIGNESTQSGIYILAKEVNLATQSPIMEVTLGLDGI